VYESSRAMHVQLSRLFGSQSSHACNGRRRTPSQWRKTLKAVLRELEHYVAVNLDTDEFHKFKVYSGIQGAREALKEDDFWPGYVEGITRLTLTLLGDYPDHRRRRRRSGRKVENHYKLNSERTVLFAQTPDQRFRTLLNSSAAGFPQLSEKPIDALDEFRSKYGYKLDHGAFLEWYRKNYPRDYASIFR